MPTKFSYIILLLLISLGSNAQQNSFETAQNHFNLDSSIYFLEQYIENPNQKDSMEIVEAYCQLANQYLDKSLYVRSEKLLAKIESTPYVINTPLAQGCIEMERGNFKKV